MDYFEQARAIDPGYAPIYQLLPLK